MAESDRLETNLTGRQSAHIKLNRRYPNDRAPRGEEQRPLPEVSVIEWEVREEVCKPYRITALVFTSEPVSRRDILGQWADFTFHTEEAAPVREFRGFVSRVGSVSRSRDGCSYRVEIRQRLGMLDGPGNCATYQNRTSADIIQEVIERNGIRPWIQVEQRLRRKHPRHPFRFQYNMGDLADCRLEMEQAGLFWFMEEGKHGEVLVIADDIDGYTRPAIELPNLPPSGLLNTFSETILSLKVRTRTVPESFIVADYNPENAATVLREEGRARNEFSIEQETGTMMGTPMVWGTQHADAAGAKREAVLRHEAARAHQVTCKGKSTMPSIRPGCIVKPDMLDAMDDNAAIDTKEGLFVWKTVHRGARNQNYCNSFRAIPAGRPYRLPIDESKWPRIHTLGFTVTSPDRYRYPYLDAEGRIIVRFHCDFGNWPKGGESVPLRMAKPFASKDRSGLNMPPVDGDHGVAGFYEGNPNKPFALAFLPNSVNPDLINSSRRRISRNEIRTRSGNNLWFDDWQGQEGIELSTEHSGRSQLNLGFIPDGDLKPRGAGAELRTSGHLVDRGGAGVMVTAYNGPGGSGKVLAMDETDAQLTDHQVFVKSLAGSAEASKASPADLDAQQAIHDGLKELKKPGVLVTGPGPVGIASGGGVHVAADGPIIGSAKKGVHFSTLRRFTVAAGDLLSMFSQKGMRLITAAGDFVAQAQRGRMQFASQGDMTMQTVDGVLHVKSSKEIVLNVGGSYLRMTPGAIEFGSRGGAVFRTSGLKKTGPAQMDLGGAAFAPQFVPYTTQCEVWRTNPDFVPPPAPPAPAPDASQWESLANTGAVAPAPDAGTGDFPPFDGKPSNVDTAIPKVKVKLDNPDDQKQTYISPDPIKLVSAAPCGWKIPDLKAEVKQHIEATSYLGMLKTRKPWKSADGAIWFRGGGSRDSKFEFAYSTQDKTITCTVRAMLVPMDLFPVDLNGARDTSMRADKTTVPYEYSAHSQMTPGSIVDGVKMDYRDAVGSQFDVKKLISRIEAVLNQGGYKLVLDGCAKGAACGCRVNVKFRVDLRVSIRGTPIPGFSPHVSLKLFPQVLRADTGSWGEQYKYKIDKKIYDYPDANVEAHECGHYFNFPDEYYDQGGWLHESYIKNEQIDFSLVDAKAGTLFWQGYAANTARDSNGLPYGGNVMGEGANAPLQPGRNTAGIKPYYLEYVRRQFSVATNKLWRVGYDA
ncbi:type VI secretion system Vgr family protein [Burkholderia sp. WSM2230]|uniref:type VI secretion system Vgr family protein n=1 Tax=Burkholderia sp. WSM2230 TaxID=944435 RepID=UPI00042A3091|nr:type VI secretion system Vgr family protein [Burkholderia sp. WSM2230]